MDNSPPSSLLNLANQVFDMHKKLAIIPEAKKVDRNFRRIQQSFEEMGMFIHNPIGESYDETRTDCEATISGAGTERLVITEVLKPMIRLREKGFDRIVQRAVVIVESKS
ncbi:MAG: resuscitation-promoting factor Rpf1 domain-containing protein [Bacteroidota bacterium]